MSEGATRSTDSSKNEQGMKKLATEDSNQKEIASRMHDSGFGSFNIGLQFFATNENNRAIAQEGDTAGGVSEAILYDPQEGNAVPSNKFIVPILNGPQISLKDEKDKKKNRNQESRKNNENNEKEGKEQGE